MEALEEHQRERTQSGKQQAEADTVREQAAEADVVGEQQLRQSQSGHSSV